MRGRSVPHIAIHSGRALPDQIAPASAGPCYLCAGPGSLRRGAEGGSCWLCGPCFGTVSKQLRGRKKVAA
jgi:hypothetical protein